MLDPKKHRKLMYTTTEFVPLWKQIAVLTPIIAAWLGMIVLMVKLAPYLKELIHSFFI